MSIADSILSDIRAGVDEAQVMGGHIVAVCKDLGLTQEKVAALAKLSPGSVANLQHGKSVEAETVNRVMDVLYSVNNARTDDKISPEAITKLKLYIRCGYRDPAVPFHDNEDPVELFKKIRDSFDVTQKQLAGRSCHSQTIGHLRDRGYIRPAKLQGALERLRKKNNGLPESERWDNSVFDAILQADCERYSGRFAQLAGEGRFTTPRHRL